MSERSDTLKSLHTMLIDSRNGYDEAVKQSDGKSLTPLFREMITLRDKAAGALAIQLTALGENPDADGSFMSTVHRTVIDVRSYLTGLDESILPSLISGEERIIEKYDDAINESSPANPEYAVLVAQRDELRAKVNEMQSMQSRSAA